MSVTEADIRHIASLARIGVPESRVTPLVAELNTILAHMEVLARADTAGVSDDDVNIRGSLPLRADDSQPMALQRPRDQFAPSMRDGFFMVPRLATHEAGESE